MKLRWTIFGASSLLLAVIIWFWSRGGGDGTPIDRLLLVLPDGTSYSDPKVTVWLDAGSEEGVHIVPIHDSEFVGPFFGEPKCAGVILPDSIRQRAGDSFIAAVRRYVSGGGQLMLVYDAGTLSVEGKYPRGWSRLSDLAGVDYALYDQLHDNTTQWASVGGNSTIASQMGIPPGKYYPFQKNPGAAAQQPGLAASEENGFPIELRRYKFGELDYPSFVTTGNYSGRVLFHSRAGVVAGEHPFGKGSVLFVNLPLGYLKANTDGLMLHSFLRYFARQTLALPYLTSVPDGVGGLVLNWHVDSNAAIRPLREMDNWSLMRQGPYSVHFTAGPDAMRIGDTEGVNVPRNRFVQGLIQRYVGLGDQVGSHGGWIHDYFASHIEEGDPKDLEKFLQLNKDALEKVTGKPVVEYSAPDGNQPQWVTQWLEAHGFVGYYFTGDTGMAPTEGYRDGVRAGRNIWAFPVVHLNQAAAFEEMATDGYSSQEIELWLRALTDFAIQQRSVRLVYFHPPGIVKYRDVIDNWMEQTARLRANGRFRWYTMAGLANFLNSRKQVSWKAWETGGVVTIDAAHPRTLEHETWKLPATRFSEPAVTRGSAHVVHDHDDWLVIAGPGQELQFETKMVNQ